MAGLGTAGMAWLGILGIAWLGADGMAEALAWTFGFGPEKNALFKE